MDWLSKVVGRSQLNGRHSTAGYANIVKLCKRVRQGGVVGWGRIGGSGTGRVGRGGIKGGSWMHTILRGGRWIDRRGVGCCVGHGKLM